MRKSRFITQSLFAVTLGIILYAVIQRLLIGVDLGDESFYAVIAKSIIAWGPFGVCESMAQLSSWVLVVPIELWRAIGMGDRGLILCLRVIYLLTLLGCCSVFYLYARKRLGQGVATLISLAPLTWIPLGIPALSYNTIAEEGFLCGLLLFSIDPILHTRDIRIWIANCLLAVACLAYPTLSPACLVFFVMRFLLARDPATRKTIALSLCFLISMGGLFFVAIVILVGAKTLMAALTMSNAITYGARQHLGEIWSAELGEGNIGSLCCQSFLAGAAALISSNPLARILIELIFLTGLITAASEQVFVQHNSQAVISLTCMFLIPWVSITRSIPQESKVACFASIFAGLIFSLTSSNAAVNFCIGAFPLFCIGLCEFLAENKSRSIWDRAGGILVTFTSLVAVLVTSVNAIAGDTKLDRHSSTCLRVGPYAWLRTTPEKIIFLRYLPTDLNSLRFKKTIYVIGPPGCYLCSDLKPLDPLMFHWALWNGLELQSSQVRDFFRFHGLPDVVLQMKEGDFSVTTSVERELLEHHYQLKIDRPVYRIFESKESLIGVHTER